MSMTNHQDHDRAVTALFDTRAAAEKVKADLVAKGLPASAVTITEGEAKGTTGTAAPTDEGFWGTLKNLFAPEEDRYAYAEGLRRGGFLLTAYATDATYDQVLHIIDSEGAVDLHEREAQWRSEGWTGYQAGHSAASAQGTPGTSTAAASATRAGTEHSTLAGRGEAEIGAVGTAGVDGEEVIPIAEERLRVGKRDVNHGRVRLRSYVVEKPVNESVNLHSERVDVSRRPVDRALSAGEDLFRERTISAEERDEEAVVSKDARVVEEVRLGKVAQDRTQEIQDTVRRTEVETDDGRTGRVGGRAAGAVGALEDQIAEHMHVVSSDGTHIGTVDHLDGTGRIKLTKNDSSDGQHHYVPRSWVSRVDDRVHLAKTAAEVRSGWAAA